MISSDGETIGRCQNFMYSFWPYFDYSRGYVSQGRRLIKEIWCICGFFQSYSTNELRLHISAFQHIFFHQTLLMMLSKVLKVTSFTFCYSFTENMPQDWLSFMIKYATRLAVFYDYKFNMMLRIAFSSGQTTIAAHLRAALCYKPHLPFLVFPSILKY